MSRSHPNPLTFKEPTATDPGCPLSGGLAARSGEHEGAVSDGSLKEVA